MPVGLTSREAKELLDKYGLNEIKETSKNTALAILLRQVKSNFIIYLLTAAMIISFFVGKSLTAYVILGVIFIVVLTGFFQEYKAEKAVNALKKMLTHVSIVFRDGKEKEIDSVEIVPGDTLILRTGEKVPADCVIIDEKSLEVNESVLTGESREVRKKAFIKGEYSNENLLFMGSLIVSGKCTAKVLHTGMNTKFGKIAGMISAIEKEMPLQKKVDFIAKRMALIGFIISVLIGVLLLFRADQITTPLIVEILIITIAVAVSSFPEGFPVVLTTALSLGAYRMAQKNAIVNRMSIIETLGETTIICSDKTGTITKGEMTVKSAFIDGKEVSVSGVGYESKGFFSLGGKKIEPHSDADISLLLKAAVLCNDSSIEMKEGYEEYKIIGSSTEAALLIMSAKANVFKEDFTNKRLEEIPFSSERKMMSVLYREKGGLFVYSKGAVEVLLSKCSFVMKKGKKVRLTVKEKESILGGCEGYSKNALRTIGFAYKTNESESKIDEKNLVFIGFVAMEDPPRDEVKSAIEECYKAGIKVKMITGDNGETAVSIARQIGFKSLKMIDGNALDNLTDDELTKVVDDIHVFARVRPEHKLRIVRALKKNGEVVTMTGDGVNDAPSLKEAHIGVAMGKNGTDVSRSVSDLILKDDNFATIVEAIKEGRSIFKNIQKFSSYQISINFSQVSLILFAILIGLPLPLVAIQILFINLFSDEILAITLAFNPYSKNVMRIKPREDSRIINEKLLFLIAVAGIIITLFTLIFFFVSFNVLGYSLEQSRTIAFLSMVFFGVANAFNFRSFRKPTLTRSPFVNRNMFYASVFVVVITVLVATSSAMQFFELVPIPPKMFILTGLFSLSIIFIFDVLKKINEKHTIWEVIN